MENPLFRKKSLERVSSPEQLNDYIRVSSPGVWMILLAIVLLLIGVCVWSVLGHLDTAKPAVVVGKDGMLVCCLKEEDGIDAEPGMTVEVGETEFVITSVSRQTVKAEELLDENALLAAGLSGQDSVLVAFLSGSQPDSFPDGVYQGQIITERAAPISFLLN